MDVDMNTNWTMVIPDWSPNSPEWSNETYKLLIESRVEKISQQTVEDIIKKSEAFPIKFPIDTGRCKVLKKTEEKTILERNINSVYPVIHENALELYCKFILFKREYGSAKEKSLYEKMSLKDFINRLLLKRAVLFVGTTDDFLLINKKCGMGNWELVGTDKEASPLIIKNCLTYDEIKLAVFLSVSSYTYFVNLGERTNFGKYLGNRDEIAKEGVIIGLIGPRLEKKNVMEYQEIVFSKTQNTNLKGCGTKANASMHKLFSEFYNEVCMNYEEISKLRKNNNVRYRNLSNDLFFDNHYYYKRLTISIDTLLVEANYRAEAAGKTAYIHVVGLGLGVWKISSHQEEVYMDTFARRISILGPNLHSVSDICFSHIDQEKCGGYKHNEVFKLQGHPLHGIKIHILKRNPHEKVAEGKLLVVSYAWDGNALPGNEYWCKNLSGSNDPAAASSTQIAEIHNPHINPLVCADQLRVVKNGKIVTFEEYQNLIRSSKNNK